MWKLPMFGSTDASQVLAELEEAKKAYPRGTPQIEVTFEVDANGVLNIKAEDKAGVKSEKITITNDKGRLSQEEIDRMVQEAEEFAEEDKKVKEKIDARNSLETYIYNMKNQINDKDKLADKLESGEGKD